MQSVAYKNDNSACLNFLIMSPELYFSSFWFPEHNSATELYLIGLKTGQCGVLRARMTLIFVF